VKTRPLAFFLPLALALAACGGDDGGGGSAADWCDYGEQIRDRGDAFESVDFLDPERLQVVLDDMRSVLDDAVRVAPAEIRADVETSRAGFGDFYAALEEAEFNIMAADPVALERMGTDLESATENIAEYNREVCGFVDDVDDGAPIDESLDELIDDMPSEMPSDAADALGQLDELQELIGDDGLDDILANDAIAGMFVDQLITEFESQGFTPDEARCMAEAYDLESILTGAFDPLDESGTFAIFEQCNISTERLIEIGGG